MSKVSCSPLFPPRFLSATLTAVAMTTIMAAADPEDRTAFAPSAKSLSQNIFRRLSHPHPKARLDIDCGSWQLICSV